MNLVLPLRREFFDAVKSGTKTEEYRRRSEHWRRRLEGHVFDSIVLTLGYPKLHDDERRIVRPWRGYRECRITHPLFGPEPVDVYAIDVSAK